MLNTGYGIEDSMGLGGHPQQFDGLGGVWRLRGDGQLKLTFGTGKPQASFAVATGFVDQGNRESEVHQPCRKQATNGTYTQNMAVGRQWRLVRLHSN
jgi:hypothetical protein